MGCKLREIRQNLKQKNSYSLAYLSKLTGISISRLSLIERDLVESKWAEKRALSKVIGLAEEELFDEKNPSQVGENGGKE